MEQSLERPLAPPYQGLLDLMRATIRTVNKQGGESPEEGSAATEAELVTLEEDTLFSSRPTILFESEVFRIDRRNTTINRILAKLDNVPRIDIAREIRGLPSAPGPAEYAVIKFPGQLRMSTFCAICRGVFSAKECKGASVVQHPNCACRGLQIYGRRCIGEALRRYKLCPAVSVPLISQKALHHSNPVELLKTSWVVPTYVDYSDLLLPSKRLLLVVQTSQ